MVKNETRLIRILVFLLGGVIILTAYLVVRINPFQIGLTYMVLLAVTAIVGLMTNFWGGLAASIIASFAIIIIDQYVGIYPRESYILNISSELTGFLLVGPLSGAIDMLLEKIQVANEHWLRIAEGRAVHDEHFGTLKPKWVVYRLEEEILRAKQFNRPLSLAVLEPECLDEAAKNERVAVLQAIIRVANGVTQPPTVVTYLGNDQVLLILPEHDQEAAQAKLVDIHSKVESEIYYPSADGKGAREGIGKPLNECIQLHSATINLGHQSTANELIEQARVALSV